MTSKVSVVIPVEPGRSVKPVVDRLARVRYPADRVEVIVAEGRQPSHQRNKAIERATGDILYFLDSDSLAEPNLFEVTLPQYDNERVAIVGGPNVSPPTDGWLQQAFDAVQTSLFGSYTVRARYRPIGVLRETTEKELILCNMSFRKSVFEAFHGFDTRLYPNEENELMNRVRGSRYLLLYQPEAIVYRSRRDSLKAFMKQNYTYGRGRMEQMLVKPYFSDLVHLVPAALAAYLLGQVWIPSWWYDIPLFAYVAVCAAFSVGDALRVKRWHATLILPWLFMIRHVAYGVGIWGGLVRRVVRRRTIVIGEPLIRWEKKFSDPWPASPS